MFRRVVVGADGSPEGQDAVALAAAVSAATGCGLTLLSAFSPFLIASGAEMDRRTLARTAERQLQEVRHRLAPDAHIEVVADSNPARALLGSAQRWHADLIIIGSDRRSPSGHSSIGHVGRNLLNALPPAVAIATRGLHEQGVPGISTVAVGYDGGAESDRALQLADRLAAGAGAALLIETVIRDPIPKLYRGDAVSPAFLQEIRDGVQLGALRVAQRAAKGTAARSRADANIGEPGDVLRRLSEGVDVMVIGARRWGAIARVVLGGVGETLVGDCGAALVITGPAPERPPSLRESPHTDPRATPTPPATPGGTIVV